MAAINFDSQAVKKTGKTVRRGCRPDPESDHKSDQYGK